LQEVARKAEKFELDLAGEQDVSCDRCGTEPADDYTIFYGHENDNHVIWTRNHINSYNAAVFLETGCPIKQRRLVRKGCRAAALEDF